MIFAGFPKFPNITLRTQTSGVIALIAICDSSHTKQSSTRLITRLESYIKRIAFQKINPIVRYTLVMFKCWITAQLRWVLGAC